MTLASSSVLYRNADCLAQELLQLLSQAGTL